MGITNSCKAQKESPKAEITLIENDTQSKQKELEISNAKCSKAAIFIVRLKELGIYWRKGKRSRSARKGQ